MKIDISFGPFVGGIMFDLVDFEQYTGRIGIVKWAAFSEKSDPNDKNIFWSKPYEDEEIDEDTKKALLYYVALEIRKIDYTCFRGEYIGKETKADIDRIIGDESTPQHKEYNKPNVQKENKKNSSLGYGMCFGVGIGAVLGLIFGNVTMGILLGAPIGLALDVIFQKNESN